ncbi:hypothetical protein TrVE_jg4293 [Triparma verrucosa]|uniref:AAA+ ATPase domain-containing protein n=1 Tax=Triparma verrucosa TaxID=1606542 RepID=A0A9W7EZN1_9STRA|nr:hypothetical protein TrVE_jg4293 [Triparma verrucosa]
MGRGRGTEQWFERLMEVQPSGIKELEIIRPSPQKFRGYTSALQKIDKNIVLPLTLSPSENALNIKPPKGCLITGMPGCGKTTLSKLIAYRLKYNLIVIRGSSILSKYTGGSEEILRRVWETARGCRPCCVFFDDVEVLAGRRKGGEGVEERVKGRILTTLLNEIDGADGRGEGIFVIGTSGRVEDVDEAMIRTGRMEIKLHLELPDPESVKEIMEVHLEEYKVSPEVDVEEMAERVKDLGWSGAEIEGFVRDVGVVAEERVKGDEEEEEHVLPKDFDVILRRMGII